MFAIQEPFDLLAIGAAAGIRTRVVGLEGQWTPTGYVLDQARLRPHRHMMY